jgi:hypothetical protein
MREDGIPIHGRSLVALRHYSMTFGLTIPVPPQSYMPAEGVYTGQDAAAHIARWFEKTYGDRQKAYLGPGSSIVVVRGEAWELNLPLIYGRVQCVVEPDLQRYANATVLGTGGNLPILNILNIITDFPQSLASQLTLPEMREILDVFRVTLDRMNSIETMRRHPLIPEALSDLAASVRHILAPQPHFGQSKWSSAQAAEKMLKSLLKAKGIEYPFNHNIDGLSALAVGAGMKSIPDYALSDLRARAGLRYGEGETNLLDAVRAHHAALLVGAHVAQVVQPGPAG